MIGRYRHRYQELNYRNDVGCQARTLDQTCPLLDVATASFGKARVSCWTTPGGRKWGVHYQQNAAVMRFRMQAAGPEDCKLSDFELDLKFSALPEGSEVLIAGCAMQGNVARVVADDQADVCLIELPAPSCVPVPPIVDCWRFRSDSIADEQSGRLCTAKWIWEINGEHRKFEGKILHGGIALRHPGKPFLMTCQVRGKVLKPGGFRLKFSNEHHSPREWHIVPIPSKEDLQNHIEQLEGEMVKLNTPCLTQGMQAVPANAQDMCQLAGRTYGSAVFSGASNTHMGDTIFNFAGGPQMQS